jgi:hypothetical protein
VTRAVRAATGAAVALAALLVLAGHGIIPSVVAAAAVAVQAVGGVVAWSMASRRERAAPDGSAELAIGSLLGIVASALASLATVGTPAAGWGWGLPTVAVAGVAVVRRRRTVVAPLSPSTAWWIALASLVALATEWTWMLPTVVGVVALQARLRTGPWEGLRPARRRTSAAVSALIAGSVAAQLAVLRGRSPAWIQFRQSVLDVPDHIFFDGLSRGVMRWGADGTGIFGAGQEGFGYHWLAYLWSGRVAALAGGDGAAMGSHVIQIVSVAACAALLPALVVHMGGTQRAGQIGAVAVAGLVAVPTPLFQSLSVYSPSHVMSVAVVLAVVAVRGTEPTERGGARLAVLAVLSVAAVGIKVTSVIPLVAFAGIDAARTVFGPGRDGRLVRAGRSVAVAVPSVAAMWWFVGDRFGSSGDSATGWFRIVSSDGPLAADQRGSAILLLGLVAVVAGLVATVPGLVLAGAAPLRNAETAAVLVAGAALSVAAGMLYVGTQTGVAYFFNAATALAAPVGIAALSASASRSGPPTRHWWIVASAASVAVSALWTNAYLHTPPTDTLHAVWRCLLMLVPIVFGAIAASVAPRGRRATAGGLAVALVASAGWVTWVPRYSALHVREGARIDASDVLAGRHEYRDALEWLRANGGPDDVVATNRQCAYHDARFPECTATWSLVAAVTGLKVYAEIPEFTRSVWPEIDDRAVASIAFVDAPSEETAAKLSTASVRWVYVDKAVTDARSWEPWARIEYENDLAAVLRLLP